MNDTFLAMIFRMRNINRWGLMHNTQPEDLTRHAAECAILAHFLAVIGNTYFGRGYNADKLAAHALFHDAPEVITGDMPRPVKYHSAEMRAMYGEIERLASARLLSMLPRELRGVYAEYLEADDACGLSDDERGLIKIADKLCAYIKCVTELNAGNREFNQAYDAIKKELGRTESDELRYFMENCAKAFELSLDELDGNYFQ